MNPSVRPELPTADLRSSQPTHAAVDNSAPFTTHPESTYKSGKVVQTNGATSLKSGSANQNIAQRVSHTKAGREGKTDDPFRTFSEWNSEADTKGYGKL